MPWAQPTPHSQPAAGGAAAAPAGTLGVPLLGTASTAPPPEEPGAPPIEASVGCLRVAGGCAFILCLLWTSLVIAGIVLMLVPNPQAEQKARLRRDVAAYADANEVLLSTAGTTVSTPARALVAGSRVEQAVDIGEPLRSTVLASDGALALSANAGAGVGTVSLTLEFRGQRYPFVSPAVALTRRATKPVFCSPAFATICGASTCCSAAELQRQCTILIPKKSPSTAVFVPAKDGCVLGEECGRCEYTQYIAELCFVIAGSATGGWKGDAAMSSCTYPCTAASQAYGDASGGAAVSLRAAGDPYLALQRESRGAMALVADNGGTLSTGRGLLLFGVLALLLLVCIVALSRFGGTNPFTLDALSRAWGIGAPWRPARKAVRPVADETTFALETLSPRAQGQWFSPTVAAYRDTQPVQGDPRFLPSAVSAATPGGGSPHGRRLAVEDDDDADL
jgi:hypothetical protein